MKANFYRYVGTFALSCVATAGASIARAAVVNDSLGVPQASVRLYTLDCPAGTHHVSGNITDKAPVMAPLVTLKMIKGVTKSETTDGVDGVEAQINPPLIGEFPSATVNINQGAGLYYLLVEKSGPGTEQFKMFVECRDAFNNPLVPVSGPTAAP